MVTAAATANAPGGWARAIAAASGRARYSARCAHASAGAPAGSVVPPGRVSASRDPAANGTSITPDAVTRARSAAGVISIDSPARADTCPYAVTSPSRASTFAAPAISSRSATSGITVRCPFPDGRRHG